MNEDSSRGSFGGRPYSSANIARPTSVRIRARSAAASGQSRGIPNAALTSAHAFATATWNAGAVSSPRTGGPGGSRPPRPAARPTRWLACP